MLGRPFNCAWSSSYRRSLWVRLLSNSLTFTRFLPTPTASSPLPLLGTTGGLADEALKIYQDASIRIAKFEKGVQVSLPEFEKGKGFFLLNAYGVVQFGSDKLEEKDAVEIQDVVECEIKALESSMLILLEVPL